MVFSFLPYVVLRRCVYALYANDFHLCPSHRLRDRVLTRISTVVQPLNSDECQRSNGKRSRKKSDFIELRCEPKTMLNDRIALFMIRKHHQAAISYIIIIMGKCFGRPLNRMQSHRCGRVRCSPLPSDRWRWTSTTWIESLASERRMSVYRCYFHLFAIYSYQVDVVSLCIVPINTYTQPKQLLF